MRELPRSTIKVVQKNLIPDGNRKKPPISNISPPKEITIKSARESVTSELSSSRPNSTASEGGCSTDDENNDGTTECSESGHESSSDDYGIENRTALDPISEEASLAKRSEDDGYFSFFFVAWGIIHKSHTLYRGEMGGPTKAYALYICEVYSTLFWRTMREGDMKFVIVSMCNL